MSSYTGPVLLIPFIGVKNERFVLTLHVNDEDEQSIQKIVARYLEDGYKPLFKDVRREYKVNGSIVHPDERRWLPALGFRRSSAHIRT
jgi:hypothetical protein